MTTIFVKVRVVLKAFNTKTTFSITIFKWDLVLGLSDPNACALYSDTPYSLLKCIYVYYILPRSYRQRLSANSDATIPFKSAEDQICCCCCWYIKTIPNQREKKNMVLRKKKEIDLIDKWYKA